MIGIKPISSSPSDALNQKLRCAGALFGQIILAPQKMDFGMQFGVKSTVLVIYQDSWRSPKFGRVLKKMDSRIIWFIPVQFSILSGLTTGACWIHNVDSTCRSSTVWRPEHTDAVFELQICSNTYKRLTNEVTQAVQTWQPPEPIADIANEKATF